MALCAEVRASSNLNMELIMSQATDTHAPSAPRLMYDNTDLALSSPRDDGELLQLCAQFNILERINRELWELDDPSFWSDLLEKQAALALKISVRPPMTLQGYRAVARALTGWTPGMPSDEIAELTDRDAQLLTFLLWSLVQDCQT
jgi:hypothetical protein